MKPVHHLTTRRHYRLLLPVMLSALTLAACHHDKKDAPNTENRTFKISITNLTANQPLSPLAAIAHTHGYHAFMDGQAASSALEKLAEGGDHQPLIIQAKADSHYLDSRTGTAPIAPGASDSLEVSVTHGSKAYLSLLSMLVNTNDGFTAANSYHLADLALHQSRTLMLPAWDAGTEANTEAAGTLPGPADLGEGYNATRDDTVNQVGIHRGVISADDGLASSVLNGSHRFDNPVARLTITRID